MLTVVEAGVTVIATEALMKGFDSSIVDEVKGLEALEEARDTPLCLNSGRGVRVGVFISNAVMGSPDN